MSSDQRERTGSNLSDLHARGVVVIWSDGDRTTLPTEYAAIAPRSRGTEGVHLADALEQRRHDIRLGDREAERTVVSAPSAVGSEGRRQLGDATLPAPVGGNSATPSPIARSSSASVDVGAPLLPRHRAFFESVKSDENVVHPALVQNELGCLAAAVTDETDLRGQDGCEEIMIGEGINGITTKACRLCK